MKFVIIVSFLLTFSSVIIATEQKDVSNLININKTTILALSKKVINVKKQEISFDDLELESITLNRSYKNLKNKKDSSGGISVTFIAKKGSASEKEIIKSESAFSMPKNRKMNKSSLYHTITIHLDSKGNPDKCSFGYGSINTFSNSNMPLGAVRTYKFYETVNTIEDLKQIMDLKKQ